VLAHPHVRVYTRDSRALLKPTVPLSDHERQTAQLAGLVAACYTDDLGLLRACLEDVVIEPQRAALIPGFARVKAAALEAGALGASISGSGPSVFALVDSEGTADRVRQVMFEAFKSGGVGEVDSWVSPVSCEGARVVR
jgi:homoserine kinase